MAILIDPARWPAHGTHFAHLASDSSLAELHAFAQAAGLSAKAFDHDHYDIAEHRVVDLVAAGAIEVEARELVSRLVAAGLRVRPAQRIPRRSRAVAALAESWATLMPNAPKLGDELLRRWQEPHRRYHDVGHLFHMLGALKLISVPVVPPELTLAAWFHDAVYTGSAGQDEHTSAALARTELESAGMPTPLVDEVFRLILLTIEHHCEPTDHYGTLLIDADLSILGSAPGRYQMYVRDVRAEHPEIADLEFGIARWEVVSALLSAEVLFGSDLGRHLWLNQARHNLIGEEIHWQTVVGRQG
jgi:predicted metal-dependent HD superfamily phosphohydrolase